MIVTGCAKVRGSDCRPSCRSAGDVGNTAKRTRAIKVGHGSWNPVFGGNRPYCKALHNDPEQIIDQPWGARVVPTTLILDTRHRIRLRGQGAIDWDAAAIDRQLQPVLN